MSKILLQIGATDFTPFIKEYSVSYNVNMKDEGTNARGNRALSLLSRKSKLAVESEMAALLAAVETIIVSANHWDTKIMAQRTATMFLDTPVTDFYTNMNETGLFNEFTINFIEL